MSILFPLLFLAPTPSPSPNPCAVRCKSDTTKCIPATKICDFVNDCGASDNTDEANCGACDFETGKTCFPRYFQALQ